MVSIFQVLKTWRRDQAPFLAAAISFYTILSLAPLTLLLLIVGGNLIGDATIREQVLASAERLGGLAGSELAGRLLSSFTLPPTGGTSLLLVAILAIFASNALRNFRLAINMVWGVHERQGLHQAIHNRLISLFMLLVVLVLLLLSVTASILTSFMGDLLAESILGSYVWYAANSLISFALLTIALAIAFRYLPRRRVPWRTVKQGAMFTAAMLIAGNTVVGILIGRNFVANLYGAAGLVVMLLLWSYYAVQIVLFGAEFTKMSA